MYKVLIADSLSPRAEQVFREKGVAVDVKPGSKADDLKRIIAAYDGLAVRSATKVTADLLAAASNLKVVGRAGIGVDNIDVSAATQRGVVVMNTPFGNSITTAEHAIALMFALARKIPDANCSTQDGRWEKARFMGVELYGKTLGVIGCGNVGSIVAELALALRMKVIAHDPFLSDERAGDLGVEKVDLDRLYARADFISLHTPLTDSTQNMINAAAIAIMKPSVRIINCARGGLIDEADLKQALEDGKVAGAAIDVYREEPAHENILFRTPGLIATPHLGASTAEAQENVAIQVAEQMADFLLTGAVTNALNMPSMTAEEAPKLKPYMKLAEQLGSFAGQLTASGLKAVQVEYGGEVAELNTRPITAVVLEGLLKPLLESVNMVNATSVARERDISVSEIKHHRLCEYHTLIRLTVTTDRQSRSVAGTLFGGDKPRLVNIKGIPIEAELAPNMLYVTNEDKPGLIGSLGTALANAGINIATFHLGRNKLGGVAIALLEVDESLSDEVLNKVRTLPHVLQAQALTL